MSETTELAGLYSVIEESARLLDVACSRDKVWPILTAYEDVIPQSAIAFRAETSARRAGDFSCRFTMIPKGVDPYALALSNDLIAKTDHPAGVLSSEIAKRCPIDNYGVDFGVIGGFTKTFQFFPPDDMQQLSKLADIPSAPRALAENASFFARHGVDDKVCLTGIDYEHKTTNVYFRTPDGYLEPKTITAILREIEMPDPSEQLLKLGQEAGGFYVTLNWDSPKIQRICFSAMTSDPMEITGGQLDPKIEQLARNAPYSGAAVDRKFICYVASSPAGEYYKLLSFYRSQPEVLSLWHSYER
ncbi:aromatic prenyltransferase [Streptomyces sp. NPDC052236]|uniref:aromatic prenyltransferase n=1 Tax=Streptomyces sp. NPDC052236 TaxID=3365686 RepID=UPI0037CF6474